MSLNIMTRRALLSKEGEFVGAYNSFHNLVHIYEPARRTLSSYIGPLVRLRRASDNAESDFGYDSDGNLDTTAIAAWAGGASYVVTVYDQVTSGDDITQAVVDKQPLYTASGQNGHPVATFDGINDFLQGAYTSAGALSQPFHVYLVTKMDVSIVNDNNAHYALDSDDVTNRMRVVQSKTPTPDEFAIIADTELLSGIASHANPILWEALFNGVSSAILFNGVLANSGDAGAKNADGLTWGAAIAGNYNWKGYIASAIICDPSHSAAQRGAMETAINDYWAVF